MSHLFYARALRGLRGVPARRLPVLAALLALMLGASTVLADRGRVKIQNVNGRPTVVASNGDRLRGAPFFWNAFEVDAYLNDKNAVRQHLNAVKTNYGMNLIRLSPWMGTMNGDNTLLQNDFGRPNDAYGHKRRFTELMDVVVDWAGDNGVYVCINFHSQYGTEVIPARVNAFWDHIAPRYKDRTHVFYEILNEPDVRSARQHMNAIFKRVRSKAPDTHLIAWSLAEPNQKERTHPEGGGYNGVGADIQGTEFGLSDLNAATDIKNDGNASFGYHSYPWNREGNNQNTRDQSHSVAVGYQNAGWPVVCTEFHSIFGANWWPIDYGYLTEQIKSLENKGIAWMQWAPRWNKTELPVTARRKSGSGTEEYSETRNGFVNFAGTYKTRLTNAGVSAWWDGSTPSDPGDGGGGGDTLEGRYRLKVHTRNVYLCMENKTTNQVDVRTHGIENGWTTAHWFLEKVAGTNNVYRVRNRFAARYLSATEDGNGKKVNAQTLNEGLWSQQWILKRVSGDTYRLQNRWTKEYVTARPASASTNLLRQWGLQTAWTDQRIDLKKF